MRRLALSAGALRFLDAFILIGPLYAVMMAERGLSLSQIGLIMAAWSLVGLVLEVPCGVLADRVSRPWLLACAQLVRVAGLLVWLLVPNFWGFLIGLMLWGMKSATMNGAFEAVIYDALRANGHDDAYVRWIGRMQAARFTGLLGASGAAALVSPRGYDVVIWASIALGLAATGAALMLPRPPRAAVVADWGYVRHLKQGALEAIALPGVARILLFIAAMQAVISALADYWQLFAKEAGLPRSGIALFIGGMAGAGALAAALAHRRSTLSTSTLCLLFALAGACVVAAGATFRPWSVVFPMIAVALYWTAEVNADSRFQHALRPETRATVASVKGVATQAGTAALMLIFGFLADSAGYAAAFMSAGAFALCVGLTFALSYRHAAA